MKRVVALLLSLIMVLSLATTGFAAKGGFTFDDATENSDWDFTVNLEDAEDDLDSQFATYVITASAKKDGALSLWGTATDVYSKGDYADVEIDGEDEFVKVADEAYADFVIVDGKAITFFAKASTYNDRGWDGKANMSILPALPADEADRGCGTRYNITEIPLVAYYCDDILYVSDADGDTILNCDGVCVVAREAVEGVDYFCKPHDVKVVYDGEKATKVYCDDCEITFPFVQGPEETAVAVFGDGNYHLVENNVWMSTKANTGGGVVDDPRPDGILALIADDEWDFVVNLEREEDHNKQTFDIYTFEAIAKKDGAYAYWDTIADVEKGDDFEVEINGATDFVEVDVKGQADVVVTVVSDDGRYTGYYAVAKDYEAGYETVANRRSLYPLPADTDDCTCYLQYSSVVDEVTDLYMWQDVWYMPDVDGTVIIKGNGKAVKANVIDTPDIISFEHSYVAELDNGSVTKVYCSRCEEAFEFIIGDEADAILACGSRSLAKSVAAETGVDNLWIWRHDVVESALTGDPSARIGDKYYSLSKHGNISVIIRDFAKPGDTVVQVYSTPFTSDAEVAAGVTFVIPADYTLTTEGDLGAEKGARIACGGTIVVGANSTVDLHNLTRQAVLKDFIGDVTIKADGLVVLPDDWGGSNWDPNKDAELLAMLKDCENGALLRCSDTTWEQVAKDQWVKIGGAEAEVVAPTVDSNIDTSKIKDAEEKAAVEAVVETLTQPDAVQFDAKANVALSEAAAAVAENDNVKVTEANVKDLAGTIKESVKKEEVVVVVQTNFDVKIEEVSVNKNGDATIKLDITPVYQHVATTKDVVESGADIKVGENAVAVSKKLQKVTQKITEPVTITIAIPDVLVDFAKENGNKLYVTHKKTSGTKFVYEAQVNVANKTATFVNPNGFSEFVISVEDTTAAEISGMKYADLQSAIDNAGKNAVITVKIPNQQAVVSNEMTFKLVYEGDAKAENTKITAASGYKLSGPDKEGSYTVTKVSYGYGGYYPSYSPSVTPSAPSVDSDSLTDAALAVGSAIKDGSAEFTPVSGYTKADVTKLQNESKLHLSIEKKIGYASVAEKDLVDAAIKAAGGAVSGTTVMYYDIKPVLELSDGTMVAYVTDTEKAVTITIDLNDDLQKAAKDGKKIAVIRCHGGKTEFLNSTLNAAKTAVTFSSADFSTYAVVALDKVKSADTFDAGIGLYVGMSVLAATGSAVVIGKKRK